MIDMPPSARVLSYVFLFSTMLMIGLEVTGRQIAEAFLRKGLMARALVANLVAVPLLGFFLVWFVPMLPDVGAGLLILAAAPGAPFALQFTSKAKDAIAFAAALLFTLTAVSLVATPPLAAALLRADTPLDLPVMRVVAGATVFLVIPLLLGFALRRRAPGVAAALQKPVTWIGALSFPAVILLTMSMKSEAMRKLTAPVIVSLLALVVGGMVIGWLLGGPDRGTRQVLATSTGMRNAMVALLVALTSFPGSDVPVTVLAFSALMVPPNLVFTIYQARRARRLAP